MADFFADSAVNPLLLSGLVGGALAGLACGLIGPVAVARRSIFLAGAIAHIAVGGVGAAIWLRYQGAPAWVTPQLGALTSALGAAVVIAALRARVATHLDTLLGALWSLGMVSGLALVKLTPGYHGELMSYLFGSPALVGWDEVGLLAALCGLIALGLALCWKRVLAVVIDPEFARLQGVRVAWVDGLLLCLQALAVVALAQVVGLILVLALLALPAATCARFSGRLSRIIPLTCALAMVLTTLPRIAAYGSALAPEAAMVLASGLVYLLSLLWRRRA